VTTQWRQILGTITLAAALVAAQSGCHPNNPSPIPPAPTVPPPPQANEPADHRASLQSNESTTAVETSASARTNNPSAAASSGDQVIAKIAGNPITLRQLEEPLVQGYGLNVLLNLVQLELAKKWANEAKVTVSPEDVTAEFDLTLAKMFQDADKTDYPRLLDQLLEQKRISRPEFDMVIQTNAYLRKIAEPQLVGKITEANLQEAFRTMYGETVQVRHIQLGTAQDVAAVKQRLANGEKFEDVARQVSENQRTRALGGELPAFSRQAPGYPQAFKDAAFALKNEGDVSDPVLVEGAYHIIKLEHRIAPKAVKFEDVKDSLREDLQDRMMQATVSALRADLQKQTQAGALVILDPTLKKQYEDKVSDANRQITDREQISKQQTLERQRMELQRKLQEAATRPAVPTTAPASGAPAGAAATPEILRPPASGSAAAPSSASPAPAAADQNKSPASSASSPTSRP
jgi:foldase protein PrsA